MRGRGFARARDRDSCLVSPLHVTFQDERRFVRVGYSNPSSATNVHLTENELPFTLEVRMRKLGRWFLPFIVGILLPTTGCTLKGTTQEITDTTSNVTASTS